jgi:hypothetical protein
MLRRCLRSHFARLKSAWRIGAAAFPNNERDAVAGLKRHMRLLNPFVRLQPAL